MSSRARLGILVSGRGSNMEALASAVAAGVIQAEVALVLSNVAGVVALDRAAARGLEARVIEHRGMARERHEALVAAALDEAGVTHVCLAGYMRVLTPSFVRPRLGTILNVHPSLLPAFPGVDAQAQAIRAGVKLAGCTVHFVDDTLDHGPIIAQEAVVVRPDDTAETLSLRILSAEHRVYPDAVAQVVSGEVRLVGGRVVVDSGR